MSLYLAIFDGDREVIGWVLGHYSDFGYFRDTLARLDDASRYARLLSHADSDGEWGVAELRSLRDELCALRVLMQESPPQQLTGAFEHVVEYRHDAKSLYDCFHNVDGDNLVEALIDLCDEALRLELPILFQ